MIDAPGAIKLFNAQPNYTPGSSETKAVTYSMLYDLQTLGKVDAAITADTLLYAVFVNGNKVNHVAYNPGNAPITVAFSDGTLFSVPSGQIGVNGTTVSGGKTPGPIPAPGPTSTPTPGPTAGGSGIQINVGGPATGSFVANMDFTGGTATGHSKTVDTSGVSNPAPQKAYQDYRYGNFTYSISGLKAGATYTVRLDFAEIYWSKARKRIFDVKLNGQQVLTNFDILATAGGAKKAVAEQFTTTANASGTITIQFITVQDNALVSGIEVLGGSTIQNGTHTTLRSKRRF